MSDNGVTATDEKTSGKDSKMLDTMTDNCEKMVQFQDYELEALLGDFVGDFDYERLVDAITRWIDGDRYYTQEWLHMEEDEIPGFLQQFEK